jgi:hypothetical protein
MADENDRSRYSKIRQSYALINSQKLYHQTVDSVRSGPQLKPPRWQARGCIDEPDSPSVAFYMGREHDIWEAPKVHSHFCLVKPQGYRPRCTLVPELRALRGTAGVGFMAAFESSWKCCKQEHHTQHSASSQKGKKKKNHRDMMIPQKSTSQHSSGIVWLHTCITERVFSRKLFHLPVSQHMTRRGKAHGDSVRVAC